jgi:phosphotransferase system HPr-like phosphotransfer protein
MVIQITVDGDDEEDAIAALEALVASGFGEDTCDA